MTESFILITAAYADAAAISSPWMPFSVDLWVVELGFSAWTLVNVSCGHNGSFHRSTTDDSMGWNTQIHHKKQMEPTQCLRNIPHSSVRQPNLFSDGDGPRAPRGNPHRLEAIQHGKACWSWGSNPWPCCCEAMELTIINLQTNPVSSQGQKVYPRQNEGTGRSRTCLS